MNILGISAFYHDSAAALVRDGQILAAAQEERFTRKKHDDDFPQHAVDFCLAEAGITAQNLDLVVFYEKPFVKFERLLETYLAYAPLGLRSFLKAMPLWMKKKLWIKDIISDKLKYDGKVLFPEHHESHAASAFFPSPFEKAAILTMDGVGEWATSSFGVGEGNRIQLLSEIRFPHSLGLLYSAFTYYTGFKVNSGEYKVMGLAPYGEPVYRDLILKELIDLRADGSFRLNMKYFNYCSGLTMTNRHFDRLFGGKPRKPESLLTQREMDLARSVQDVTEEVMLRMSRHVHKVTGMKNLCLAGGVALNCVGNGKLLKQGPFEKIWIQPAAGDSGGALGAALLGWFQYLGKERHADGSHDIQRGSLLGPRYSDEAVRMFLDEAKIPYEFLEETALPEVVAGLVNEGKVIGWFQGRMEFGPRALGARSILGDARSPQTQEVMNLKIKFRESFRPFAPTVLRDQVSDYFDMEAESPYMLLVAPVRKDRRKALNPEQDKLFGIEKLKVARSDIPAVTHVDYSARIQTVASDEDSPLYSLLEAMKRRYGCGVIVNTSFNVRGEPIVNTPEEAYRCFMRTHMDYLVLGRCLIDKTRQPEWKDSRDWKKEFVLD